MNTLILLVIVLKMSQANNTIIDSFFPMPSPGVFIMTIIFYIACLWVIKKKEVREVFAISRIAMFISIVAPVTASLLINLIVFNV